MATVDQEQENFINQIPEISVGHSLWYELSTKVVMTYHFRWEEGNSLHQEA